MIPPDITIPTLNHSRDGIVDSGILLLQAFQNIPICCQAIKQEEDCEDEFLHVSSGG
jgi:hypothetical protein